MLEKKTIHAAQWKQIEALFAEKRLPPALLLSGSRALCIEEFCNRLIATILCTAETMPCGECQACSWVLRKIHPDVQYVHAATPQSPIKIEQIRLLQQEIYHMPRCGKRRIVVIDPADHLNVHAANALLKILEEPPEHILFILIATHVSSLPKTIISRCQRYVFYANSEYPSEDWVQKAHTMAEAYRDFMMRKTTASTVALAWSTYPFEECLSILGCILAQHIYYIFLTGHSLADTWATAIAEISVIENPVDLFIRFDTLSKLLRDVQAHVALNQTLALETILLGSRNEYPFAC